MRKESSNSWTNLPSTYKIGPSSRKSLARVELHNFHVSASLPKTRIVAAFGKRSSQTDVANDATLEFGAEAAVAVKDPSPPKYQTSRRPAQIAAATLLLAAMGAAVYWADRLKVPTAVQNGSLRIETDPAGAEVRVDGSVRGVAPLALTIPIGKHVLSVQHNGSIKQLPVDVTTGAVTVHHITWTDTPAASIADSGNLSISTDAPGGQVSIDGQDRGATPLTVRNLPPGQHRVVVRSGGTTHTRTVQIEAGVTASLVLTGGAPATPPWGWVSVSAPFAVQVFESEHLIGTSDVDRIMLPGGEHDLELVSDAVGYRATRKVKIAAGQTASLALDLPKTPVSINAVPWAEVFVDGTRLGETPLANVSIAPGPHEIVFRHPQMGERRTTTMVTLKGANRVSMDMRSR